MLEAICGTCHETFIPADEDDLVHGETEAGEPCGGLGVIAGEWVFTGTTPAHVVVLDETSSLHGQEMVRVTFDENGREILGDTAGTSVGVRCTGCAWNHDGITQPGESVDDVVARMGALHLSHI